MREIKFRAWDKDVKKFADMCAIHVNGGIMASSQTFGGMYDFVSDEMEDRIVIQQYTGLKDKNGVEIYEGDVVRTYHPFSKFDYNDEKDFVDGEWLCQWEAPRFIFTPINNKGIGILARTGGELCEVIGNIYENPELLNEKN